MGLFWDKLKAMFKSKTDVEIAYEKVIDASDWKNDPFEEFNPNWERQLYKQSAAPVQLVAVGFGPEYDNKLAIRKTKSQSRNWKRWKNRV